MPIRDAHSTDLPQLLELSRAFHRETVYRDVPFDDASVVRRLQRYLGPAPDRALWVAEQKSQLVGMLAGYLDGYLFNDDAQLATDAFFFVVPEQRAAGVAIGLIGALKSWGRSHGVHEVALGIASGIHSERTGAFYQRLGFRHCGCNYRMP